MTLRVTVGAVTSAVIEDHNWVTHDNTDSLSPGPGGQTSESKGGSFPSPSAPGGPGLLGCGCMTPLPSPLLPESPPTSLIRTLALGFRAHLGDPR